MSERQAKPAGWAASNTRQQPDPGEPLKQPQAPPVENPDEPREENEKPRARGLFDWD